MFKKEVIIVTLVTIFFFLEGTWGLETMLRTWYSRNSHCESQAISIKKMVRRELLGSTQPEREVRTMGIKANFFWKNLNLRTSRLIKICVRGLSSKGRETFRHKNKYKKVYNIIHHICISLMWIQLCTFGKFTQTQSSGRKHELGDEHHLFPTPTQLSLWDLSMTSIIPMFKEASIFIAHSL